MKLNQTATWLQNKQSESTHSLPEDKISIPVFSSHQEHIALIRQPGKWPTDIGERILTALVNLSQWPCGRTLSVIKNNAEICRYGAGEGMDNLSASRDITLFYRDGYYQSAAEFHSGTPPDGDSLFRAIIDGLGENIYAKSAGITKQQIVIWRDRVADALLEQEKQVSPGVTNCKSAADAGQISQQAGKKALPHRSDPATVKSARARFYDSLVRQSDTTEAVVAAGALLQREIHGETRAYPTLSPSGNRKSRLAHYFGLLFSGRTPAIAPHQLRESIQRDGVIISPPAYDALQGAVGAEKPAGEVNTKARRFRRAGEDQRPASRGEKRRGDTRMNPDAPPARKRAGALGNAFTGRGSIDRWPEEDKEIQRRYFPDISEQFIISKTILNNPKISLSQNSINTFTEKLFSLYDRVTSQSAKNDLIALFSELNTLINNSGRSLVLTHHAGFPISGSIAEAEPVPAYNIPDVSELISMETWPPADITIQQQQFSELFASVELIIASAENRQVLSQQQVTESEVKLWFLYQQLQSSQARNGIARLLKHLSEKLSIYDKELNLLFLPNFSNDTDDVSQTELANLLKKQKFSKKTLSTWPETDRNKQQEIYPSFLRNLKVIKEGLNSKEKPTKQRRVNLLEKNLRSLYENMISQQAKDDIISLWYEIKERIQQSGKNLVLAAPPGDIRDRGVIAGDSAIRQSGETVAPVEFARELINSWPKLDRERQQIILPNLSEMFLFIKKELLQSDRDVYQQWINVFETKISLLYDKVMSQQAKNDLVGLSDTLKDFIQQSGKNLISAEPLQSVHREKTVPVGDNMPLAGPADTVLTGSVISSDAVTQERSEAEKFTRFTILLWPEDDQRKQQEIFPDITQRFSSIKRDIQLYKSFRQRRLDQFETKVLSLYDSVADQQAKDDLISLLRNLKKIIEQSQRPLALRQFATLTESRSDLSVAGQMPPITEGALPGHPLVGQPVFSFNREQLAHWLLADISIQQAQFPGLFDDIDLMAHHVENPQLFSVSAEWFAATRKKFVSLRGQLTGAQAKKDISELLYQFVERSKDLGIDRAMFHSWPEVDRNIKQTLFPLLSREYDTIITKLKNSDAKITQGKITRFELRASELRDKVTSYRARNDIIRMLLELGKVISESGTSLFLTYIDKDNPARLQQMNDFTHRDISIRDNWSAHDVAVQREVSPSFFYNMKKLADKSQPALADVQKMDDEMALMLQRFSGDQARDAIRSVQSAMYRYFREKSIPTEKNIHLFSERPRQSLRLLPLHTLKNMAETLTLWTERRVQHNQIMKKLLGKIIRIQFLSDISNRVQASAVAPEGLRKEHLPLLRRYNQLMLSWRPDMTALKLVIQQIGQQPELRRYIKTVEYSIPYHAQKVLMDNREKWGHLSSATQRQHFVAWCEKYRNPEITRQARAYTAMLASPPGPEADLSAGVSLRETERVLAGDSLWQRMVNDGYTFEDLAVIGRYLLAESGQTGLLASDSLRPALSEEVTALLERHLGYEASRNGGVLAALYQALEHKLASRGSLSISPHGFPAAIRGALEEAARELEQIPAERWFEPESWSVPVAGIRFSSDGGQLSDRSMIMGNNQLLKGEAAFRLYLNTLYEFHHQAMTGALSEEGVTGRLHALGLTAQIPASHITAFVRGLQAKPWQSLTQIHGALTRQSSLASAMMSWSLAHVPLLAKIMMSAPSAAAALPPALPEAVIGSPSELWLLAEQPAQGGAGTEEIPELDLEQELARLQQLLGLAAPGENPPAADSLSGAQAEPPDSPVLPDLENIAQQDVSEEVARLQQLLSMPVAAETPLAASSLSGAPVNPPDSPASPQMPELENIAQQDVLQEMARLQKLLTIPAGHEQPQAGVKYQLLKWLDLYRTHISRWDDVSGRWQAISTGFQPQSLLTSGDGMCMGLSLAALRADTPEKWRVLRRNLGAAGALRLRLEEQRLPLSDADNGFLAATLQTLRLLQEAGNQQIRHLTPGDGILVQAFSTPQALTGMIMQYQPEQLLITTEKHSLTLQKYGAQWRVTDPNLGSATFATPDNAAEFLFESVRLTPTLRQLYGATAAAPSLSAYFGVSAAQWQRFLFPSALAQDGEVLTTPYSTTYERLQQQDTVLAVSDVEIKVAEAYQLGLQYRGKMLTPDDSVFRQHDLSINGFILQHYLARHALSADEAAKIRTLARAVGFAPGTPAVADKAIQGTGQEMVALHHRLPLAQQRSEKIITALMRQLSQGLGLQDDSPPGQYSVSGITLDKEQGQLAFDIDDGTQTRRLSLPVDEHLFHMEYLNSLSQGGAFARVNRESAALAESGILDVDIGLALMGIIQGARYLQQGGGPDPLTVANMGVAVKQSLEATLGNLIMAASGQALGEEGIATFRVERQLAGLLRKAGLRVGGTLGQGLSRLSAALELPVVDIGLSAGNLISSAAGLSLAQSCEEKSQLAAQVAFNSLTLLMTTASLAAPALTFPAMVVGAIGLGVEAIARNLGAAHDRYYTWAHYRDFLVSNEQQMMLASPERGLLDFSGNHICGGVRVDFTTSPPTLSGQPSFDSHRTIGHLPDRTPKEIRERLGYGYPYTRPLADPGRRRWPSVMPAIPEGNYTTLVLGYGRTLKLITRVEYISDWLMYDTVNQRPSGGYWETVDRLPEFSDASMEVIGGSQLLTLVAPDAGKDDQHYLFTIKGGSGGIRVQTGNLGAWDINGDPRAAINALILTEKQMGQERDYLSFYQVDLTNRELQDIYINKGNGPDVVHGIYPDRRLRVKLRHISHLICQGESIVCDFRGGNGDNVFFASMGKIRSGPGGHNQYHINLKSGRYPVDYRNGYPGGLAEHAATTGLSGVLLALESGARSHRVYLDTPLHQLMSASARCIALREDAPGQPPVIPVDFFNAPEALTRRIRFRIADESGSLSLLTSDGIQLSWHGEGEWRISQINLDLWRACHPQEGQAVEEIILAYRERGWPALDTSVSLLSAAYHVTYHQETDSLSWTVQQEGVTLVLPQRFPSVIFGTPDSRYLVRGGGNARVSLLLAADPSRPEVLDLRESDCQVEGEYRAGRINFALGNQTLVMENAPDGQSGGFANSTSRIYLPGGRIMTLARLQRKLNQSLYPMLLVR